MEEIKEPVIVENTERVILQCAEEVFMERGFDGARTTEIAKRAGVNHAMIHYYFRTKKNLFGMVFQDKLSVLASSFSDSLMGDRPFFEKIETAIEAHFDFLAENPRLLFFIYSEITNDEERKMMLIKSVVPKVRIMLEELNVGIEEEVSKGNIRSISAAELLLNIVALNATTFLAQPLMEVIISDEHKREELMAARKKSNVEFIISSLKINIAKPSYTQTSLNFDM